MFPDQQRNQDRAPVQSFAPPPPSPPAGEYLSVSVLANFLPLWEPFGVYVRLTGVTALLVAFLREEWWLSVLVLLLGMLPHWHSTSLDSSNPPLSTPAFVSTLARTDQKRTDWSRLAFALLAVQATAVVILQWWLWSQPCLSSPYCSGSDRGTAWILGRLLVPPNDFTNKAALSCRERAAFVCHHFSSLRISFTSWSKSGFKPS